MRLGLGKRSDVNQIRWLRQEALQRGARALGGGPATPVLQHREVEAMEGGKEVIVLMLNKEIRPIS